jgi:signal transduction histidine kinase
MVVDDGDANHVPKQRCCAHDPTIGGRRVAMNGIQLLRRRSLVFPVACAAALLMVFISESSYWQSVRTLDAQGSMAGARNALDALQAGLLEAEAVQRGYLHSASAEPLERHRQALHQVDAAFDVLDPYYVGQPEPFSVLVKLHALTASLRATWAERVRVRDGNAAGAPPPAETAAIAAGQAQLAAMRRLAGELWDREATRAAASRVELHRNLQAAHLGVAALGAANLLALWLYLRQTAALKREQLRLESTMQAERDRLEIEVRRRTAQLTELTHHLQTAREDERQRLARNLHDELGALLTSAKLDAARIRSRLGGTAPEALERLAHLVETLNASIALGRSIIEDLRPSTLANLGLVATLQILAREFTERSGVEVDCQLQSVRLDANAELTVYRLVQEAITNISKHARARQVWLAMALRGGRVEVTVRDDGAGFDAQLPLRSAYGLVGMRFRVEAAGGRLVVDSAPGHGTQLTLTLPESTRTATPSLS